MHVVIIMLPYNIRGLLYTLILCSIYIYIYLKLPVYTYIVTYDLCNQLITTVMYQYKYN